MRLDVRIANCERFEWDEGNLNKLWERHRVSASEFEQIFFHEPLVAVPDEKHSDKKERFYALGHTDTGRPLFVVFAIRNNLIRPISARDMNRRERKEYEAL